jgi:hypothetical protein
VTIRPIALCWRSAGLAAYFAVAGVFAFPTIVAAEGAVAQTLPPARKAPAPVATTPNAGTNTALQPRLAPTAATTTAPAGDIVARVGDREMTVGELRGVIAGLPAEQQAALARDPTALSQTVRLMLAGELVLKEANEKKWADQPGVAAQLARVREKAIVESYVLALSTPPANYPDEAEIQRAYDANKSAFIVPRQFRVAQVFIAAAAGDRAAEDQGAKKLAEIQTRLKQPKADFLSIAKDASDAHDNADLGWLPETQIRPEIRNQLAGLPDNGVGEPLKLADGWHIVKLLETKQAEARPLAEVHAALTQTLRTQRAEALRQAYVARLLEQSPPAINELALGKVFDTKATTTAVTR